MRLWWCAGASLPYDLGMKVEEKLGGTILTVLGATDWGCECLNLPSSPQQVRLKTVGKPIDDTEIKLVDEDGQEVRRGEVGEIWGRGPAAVSGYFKDAEATKEVWTEDGWYMTGDLGTLDEMGNLIVVGRKKDMIIRGGQNIYPIEIENLLRKHPKISDVAVIGMPDPLMGQRACAFVVPQPGQEFSFDEMLSFLRERNIALFKFPERLELIEKIPMVGSGQKVDKKLLEKDIQEKLKREGRL
jgi:non-ribosomal peptide synthetase component E (peptide arylation enzyme)